MSKVIKKVSDLSEREREEFCDAFYGLLEGRGLESDLVSDNPNPWGCPWYYGRKLFYRHIINREDLALDGETAEEMAENYFFEWVKED